MGYKIINMELDDNQVVTTVETTTGKVEEVVAGNETTAESTVDAPKEPKISETTEATVQSDEDDSDDDEEETQDEKEEVVETTTSKKSDKTHAKIGGSLSLLSNKKRKLAENHNKIKSESRQEKVEVKPCKLINFLNF